MRTLDKAGVHLEQCENCRGIFLDHGELEQILQAEQRYYGGVPAYGGGHGGRPDSPGPLRHRPDSPRPYRGERHGHSDSPRPYRGERHGYGDSPRPYGHRRGKGSFLGDLFG